MCMNNKLVMQYKLDDKRYLQYPNTRCLNQVKEDYKTHRLGRMMLENKTTPRFKPSGYFTLHPNSWYTTCLQWLMPKSMNFLTPLFHIATLIHWYILLALTKIYSDVEYFFLVPFPSCIKSHHCSTHNPPMTWPQPLRAEVLMTCRVLCDSSLGYLSDLISYFLTTLQLF